MMSIKADMDTMKINQLATHRTLEDLAKSLSSQYDDILKKLNCIDEMKKTMSSLEIKKIKKK